jgi:regulatory protein
MASDPDAARASTREVAIRLLGRREYSGAEMRRKLVAKGLQATVVDRVVDQLVSDALLSDGRFAEALVRSRVERGQGPIKIRAELRDRGISEELIEDTLTHAAEFWLERAERARRKRFGEDPPGDRGQWNREARFLAQRGFPADLIYRVLGESRMDRD